ncbi:MAG: TIGR04076 family protein [Anaerolineaceae bacterium]|nr:TIGR04076 family protein [Anaerolineaceae bacterium]
MTKAKITVIKRMVNFDIIKEFIEEDSELGPCNLVEDGQVFIQEGWEPPEGFCPWAWSDIHKEIMLVRRGGSQSETMQKGTAIACCTDGFRPVVFRIERLDD